MERGKTPKERKVTKMKVSELMALLATMPADAEVRFPDTYAESEGWGECEPYCTVYDAVAEDGAVTLLGE